MKAKFLFMVFLVLMIAVPLQSAHAAALGLDVHPQWKDCDGVKQTAKIIVRAEIGGERIDVYFSELPSSIETKKDGNCVKLDRDSTVSFKVKKCDKRCKYTSEATITQDDTHLNSWSWNTDFEFNRGHTYQMKVYSTYSDGKYQEIVTDKIKVKLK